MAQWLPTLSAAAKTYHRRDRITGYTGLGVGIVAAIIGMIRLPEITFWGFVGRLLVGAVCGVVAAAGRV